MKKIYQFWLVLLLLSPGFTQTALAQETDTLQKYQDPPGVSTKRPFYKSKLVKASIVPALMIGYGVSTIKDNGFYSSYDAQRDIQKNFPNFHTWVDDPLLVAPYIELAVANLFGQRSNHDLLNTTLVILKAEAIFGVTVYTLKHSTNQVRPNGKNRESLPSGHTAQAFLAASILHTEMRHRSNWYGVGAYTIATSVGVFRMLNNAHWQSDVFVGAGIGILSAHLAYLSHRNRWGRKPTVAIMPTYIYNQPGISLTINPQSFSRKKQLPSPEYQHHREVGFF